MNKLIRILIGCFIFTQIQCVWGQENVLKIGLFRGSSIKEITLELNENSHIILQTNMNIWGTKENPSYQIIAKENNIEIYQNSQFIGRQKQVEIQSEHENSVLLKSTKPNYKGNRYSGILIIRSNNGNLKLINKVDESHYLLGVLRGEVGYDKKPALYEVHAILSRTYARFYKDRHRSEGFELCDQTHCQVYKGYFDYTPYKTAIKLTENTVVLDSLSHDIAELLYHSNCGGQTSASEDVWQTHLPYCRSIRDTFCLNSEQATWEKQIPLEVFCNKLNLLFPTDSVSKMKLCDAICSFSLNRPNELSIGKKNFKVTEIRFKLELKSAWFNWECNGDTVYLFGKGFGHGVGMCQEGAIKMAELGFSHNEIIRHYFKKVLIAKR